MVSVLINNVCSEFFIADSLVESSSASGIGKIFLFIKDDDGEDNPGLAITQTIPYEREDIIIVDGVKYKAGRRV